MKKLVCILVFLFVSFPLSSYALNSEVEKVYNNYIKAIETRYSLNEQNAKLLLLRDRLSNLSYQNNSEKKSDAIQDFFALNNEKIYQNWLKNENAQSSQKSKELLQRVSLQKSSKNIIHPSYISQLLTNKNINFIYLNSRRELEKEGDIYQFVYAQYIPISEANTTSFSQKTGVVIIGEEGDYRFVTNYTLDKKIPYSELGEDFLAFITSENKIYQKNGKIYGFLFQNFLFYKDEYGVYEKELQNSKIDTSKTLLYLNDAGVYNFVTDFTQRELISETDVFGIPEKQSFLKYLLADAKFLESDIPSNMLKIQAFTKTLTLGQTKEQKLGTIYNWILQNIEYSEILDINDMKIFSGGEAFLRGDGVCTAYSRLMAYMMLYSGFYDVEVIEGYVIDAQDFPNIGHAWLRYQDLYFDPTFDDPVGSLVAKTQENYKYFNIPKDIFYANRFLYSDIPDNLLTASKNDIEKYIFNTLVTLIPKYKSVLTKYEIFSPVVFRNTYNIDSDTLLTPELLAQKIGSYTVDGKTLSFTQNNTKKYIKKIKYYTLDEDSIEVVLSLISYNFDNTYLFYWETEQGQKEWRLAYDVEFQ